MTIYYQDDRVTLYHGDCREVLAGMADESVAAVLTDPPYTERTHRNAKANDSTKGYAVRSVTFASISDADLRESVAEMARVSQGWVVSTLDYRRTTRVRATARADRGSARTNRGNRMIDLTEAVDAAARAWHRSNAEQ